MAKNVRGNQKGPARKRLRGSEKMKRGGHFCLSLLSRFAAGEDEEGGAEAHLR